MGDFSEDKEDLEEIVSPVDTSRHFSYFAFEGRTGVKRWGHESRDFHRDAAELAEVTAASMFARTHWLT